MIFHPHIGQCVRMHYAKRMAGIMPQHGKVGVVRVVSRGPGPRNVGVEIDGRLVTIPRGNLVAMEMPKNTPARRAGVSGEEG